jgi:hypothetical protein
MDDEAYHMTVCETGESEPVTTNRLAITLTILQIEADKIFCTAPLLRRWFHIGFKKLSYMGYLISDSSPILDAIAMLYMMPP